MEYCDSEKFVKARPRRTTSGCVALLFPALCLADQVSHTYDDLNRLVRTDYGNGTVIEYAYDAAGNRLAQTVTEPLPPPPPPNVPPSANGGPDRVVRLNSLVTLNGSASVDPDNGPEPLSYRWAQMTGATLSLTGDHTSNLTFTPGQEGI
jgi:YD repeat-containing protein